MTLGPCKPDRPMVKVKSLSPGAPPHFASWLISTHTANCPRPFLALFALLALELVSRTMP